VATDETEDTPTEETSEPIACNPCRGTGKVISGLGGSPSTLPCPWCEGTGTFIPGHDAQAKHAESAQ